MKLVMTVYVTMCSGMTPGGKQPQMMHPHGEKVEERMLIVMTAVNMTSAVSVVTAVMTAVTTAVTETVEMTVNPEVQPEVRKKVRKCQKNIVTFNL